jgi:hypothetical protein
MDIAAKTYKYIDFLRLPRPHGERRTENEVRARRSQNQFTPPCLRVAASAKQGWGRGK